MQHPSYRLRLQQSISLYKRTNLLPKPFRHLAYALIYWLESLWIDAKTEATVNTAIDAYKAQEGHQTAIRPPIYQETTKAGHRLPQMRLTAPWVSNSSQSQQHKIDDTTTTDES